MVIWFTGEANSGKTTMAVALKRILGEKAILLDAQEIRMGLCRDLGYSLNDRRKNIERVACVAEILQKNGLIPICSLITPYEFMRDAARLITDDNKFILIYLNCPFNERLRRDKEKGVYSRKYEAEGYEVPVRSDLVINTMDLNIEQSIEAILKLLPPALRVCGSEGGGGAQ